MDNEKAVQVMDEIIEDYAKLNVTAWVMDDILIISGDTPDVETIHRVKMESCIPNFCKSIVTMTDFEFNHSRNSYRFF